MTGKTVIVSYEEMMEYYVPEPAEEQEPLALLQALDFTQVPQRPEKKMYGPMTTSLNHSWLLPEDVVVVTPHKPDPDVPTNENTDGGLYKVKDAPTKEQEHTKWAHIELVIECKVEETQEDPFEDDEKMTPEASGGERQKNLAQIMGYARNVFEYLDGCILGEHARKMFAKSLVESSRWWRLKVEDESGVRTFLVGAPSFVASGLAGRATQGYVAIDETDPYGPLTYLKDTWRVAHDRIQQEGKTLKDLNSEKDGGPVPYVPTLVCHGDVKGQVTASQEAWRRQHPEEAECPLKTHHHYRLVVKEVCLPMSDFENAYELVSLVAFCIDAHSHAFLRKGYLHRDVSVGNTLIYPEPMQTPEGEWEELRIGLLTDWELAGGAHDTSEGARQPDRTMQGTWQFMSASALADAKKRIIVQDDMESFFHILLYLAIRYLPHDCRNVGLFMDQYFDGHLEIDGEYLGGDLKWNTMRNGELAFAQAKITFYIKEKSVNILAQASGALSATTQNPGPVQGSDQGKSLDGQPAPIASVRTRPLHPINDLFTEFLRRLKAHYTLRVPQRQTTQAARKQEPQPTAVKSSAQAQSIKKNMARLKKRLAHLGESPTSQSTPKSTPAAHKSSTPLHPPMSDAQKAEAEALAEELGVQTKIAGLLYRWSNGDEDWPGYIDRVPDQLEPKYRINVEERAADQAKRSADGPPESDARPSKTSRRMR